MFAIKADNPKGLNYDLLYESAELAGNAIRTIIARGGKNITVNGHKVDSTWTD